MEDIVIEILDINDIPDYATKEEERQNNELARQNAETERNNNELERILTENNRQTAESQRASLYNEVQAKVQNGDFDGEDGYSPTVTTSKSGKTTTIVITDKNGDHTATILDGEDGSAGGGDMLKSIYDTNDSGVVDNAEKVNNHTVQSDVPANAVFTDTVFSGNYNDLTNKPSIPGNLSDLNEDATHRVVTDSEKTTWNNKQESLVSGTNIKTINDESILGDGNIVIQGGASYTAGANIEITSNNVINNTLPIDTSSQRVKMGDYASVHEAGSIAIGYSASASSGIAIGRGAVSASTNGNNIVIGANNRASQYDGVSRSIAIGMGTTNYTSGSTGNSSPTKSNQVMFGTGQNPITEIAIRTGQPTSGNENIKVMATEEFVTNYLSTLTGYDNTKTQILKNVNGTLTWVDEV